MAKITTIKIKEETKIRLERLKEHKRESYDEVIKKILFILNKIRKDPLSGNRILSKIDKNIKRKDIFYKNEEQKSFSKNQIRERAKTESSTG
jgi:hypothetical protein